MSSQSNIAPGPIAPENNPPINPQYFQPKVFDISNITLGQTTTITTSVDHDYVIGQLTRLLIPRTYGAQGLNEQLGYVISIPATNQVVLNLYSNGFSPFIPTPTYGPTPPQIVAVGDINSGPINIGRMGNQTFIDGSFINISPN